MGLSSALTQFDDASEVGKMIWILLVLNLVSALIAARKRILPYTIFSAIFTVLVVGQAFQMETDFQSASTLYYAFSTISKAGFDHALWYVLAVSVISLLTCILSRGYRKGSQPHPRYHFSPPRSFYVLVVSALSIIGGVLIFGVVGLSAFLSRSRPGDQTGATLFITFMSIGLFPLLLKLLLRSRVNLGDITCFGISLLVTAGFSRLHVIMYLLVLLITLFYCRGIADRPFSLRFILAGTGFAGTLLVFFFVVGALRDALNYTHGSIGDLISYNLNHPETSLLSLQYTYRVSIEGISGLAGALSDALWSPGSVHRDYGVAVWSDGLVQMMPSVVKDQIKDLITVLQAAYWYKKPGGNVSPGIETAFVSFGWLGIAIYPLLFWITFWKLPLIVLEHRISPPLQLAAFMLFGCGVFFVRGSWPDWVAFSLAYFILVYVSWALFGFYVRSNDAKALQ